MAAAAPEDEAAALVRAMGADFYDVPVDARGLSPLRDARLLLNYYSLLGRLRPSAFLGFTAKPNIYGSIAASWLNIPVINTITGLGTGFLTSRSLEGIVSTLYRWSLRRSQRVFFHNPEDRDLFVGRGLASAAQAAVVAGSGVNLCRFSPTSPPPADRPLTFLFIGRLLKDKGAVEFAQAASIVRNSRSARFQMLGRLEEHPKAVQQDTLETFVARGTVELIGPADDVRPFIADADCVVLPSYREGLSRVLLEASAMGTPVITTDVPGCRHAVDHGVTGLICAPRSAISLAKAIIAMIDMSPSERSAMGINAREKAEGEFSEERVVGAYLDALREIGV